MSTEPETLRLAKTLENPRRWHELTDDECDCAAAELRRLHAQSLADERLLREAMGAFTARFPYAEEGKEAQDAWAKRQSDAVAALRQRLGE